MTLVAAERQDLNPGQHYIGNTRALDYCVAGCPSVRTQCPSTSPIFSPPLPQFTPNHEEVFSYQTRKRGAEKAKQELPRFLVGEINGDKGVSFLATSGGLHFIVRVGFLAKEFFWTSTPPFLCLFPALLPTPVPHSIACRALCRLMCDHPVAGYSLVVQGVASYTTPPFVVHVLHLSRA